MKNLIYLLLAGSLFVACNNGGESASTTTAADSTATTPTATDPNAMAPDTNAMQMPPEPTPGNAAAPYASPLCKRSPIMPFFAGETCSNFF